MANLKLKTKSSAYDRFECGVVDSQDNVSDLLKQLLINQSLPSIDICVGLSGGIDSVVLLHLLNLLRRIKSFNLTAIHVNHGISPLADNWSEFCQVLCRSWEISLFIAHGEVVKEGGEGLENSARKFRYREYAKLAPITIALAHHQDDQVETVLSQLMRGSDIHNLAGMRSLSKRKEQCFWRPLLGINKERLIAYGKENNLIHIEDDSNSDNSYLRNFLRNQIIPKLVEYDPQVKSKIVTGANLLQSACALNDELAKTDLFACRGGDGEILLAIFCQLSFPRQVNLLNYFLSQAQIPLPSRRKIHEFIRQVTSAAADRHPQLSLFGNRKLCRLRHKIIIICN